MNAESWSRTEKAVAREAFDKAYERECASIVQQVRDMLEDLDSPRNIWRVHDLLSRERRQTDRKYDYRYSVLSLVFARLIVDGWLSAEDLDGLRPEKLSGILKTAEIMRGDVE